MARHANLLDVYDRRHVLQRSLRIVRPIIVAGAEQGSLIAITTGLRVGMPYLDALSIAVTHYLITEHTTGYTTCRPHSNEEAGTELTLHYENGQITFIGLYAQ